MYSIKNYTGNGTNKQFPIEFDYLDDDELDVLVGGSPVAFTVTSNPKQINITHAAPANGAQVTVKRITSIESPKVDFVDGSNLLEEYLDRAVQQNLFAIQEFRDDYSNFVDYVANLAITAGNLPAPGSNQVRFIYAVDGNWGVHTLSEMQAALGISDVDPDLVDDRIADADGEGAVLYTDGDTGVTPQWVPRNKHDIQTWLDLGDLAYKDADDYPILGDGGDPIVVGTAPGNVIALDVDGKLPAVDGSQLTNIQKRLVVRADYSKAGGGTDPVPNNSANHGGAYPDAGVWQDVPLNAFIYNQGNTADFDSGSGILTVPAGTYEVEGWVRFRIPGVGQVQLTDETNAVFATGGGKWNKAEEAVTYVRAILTTNSERQMKLRFRCRATPDESGEWDDPRALGMAAPNTTNIYASLTLVKVPA